MMAPLNIFSPSSGKPIMTPTQDITLGCYYLTAEPRLRKDNDRLMLFATKSEVIFAHVDGAVEVTHDRIRSAIPTSAARPSSAT
jgi:DNA-directed RNA polymerase subunit beta'